MEGAKLFVGLGFPFEAPSPLEALQAGCYFINPIWDPPIGRSLDESENSKEHIKGLIDIKGFFNDKPTLRHVDSQVPYLASLNFTGQETTGSFQRQTRNRNMQWQLRHRSLTRLRGLLIPYKDKIITTRIDDPENNEFLIDQLSKIKSETEFERLHLEEFSPLGLQKRINRLFQKKFC